MTSREEDSAKTRYRKALEEQSRQQFREMAHELRQLQMMIQRGEEAFVKGDMKNFEQDWAIYQKMKAKDTADHEKQRRRNLLARGVKDIHKEPWNA